MRIAFCETKSWEEDYLRRAFTTAGVDAELSFFEGAVTSDVLPPDASDISAEVLSVFVSAKHTTKTHESDRFPVGP